MEKQKDPLQRMHKYQCVWYPWPHESWQDVLFIDIPDHMNHGRTCCSVISLTTWIMAGRAVLWYPWSHESWQDVLFCDIPDHMNHGRTCSSLTSLITWIMAGHAVLWYPWSLESRQDVLFFIITTKCSSMSAGHYNMAHDACVEELKDFTKITDTCLWIGFVFIYL
jgi:hypothetical protein